MYRVAHLVANLGWVDLNFDYSTVCLILPGLMGVWQKWLGSWGRRGNSQIQVNRTQVRDQMVHPVHTYLLVILSSVTVTYTTTQQYMRVFFGTMALYVVCARKKYFALV